MSPNRPPLFPRKTDPYVGAIWLVWSLTVGAYSFFFGGPRDGADPFLSELVGSYPAIILAMTLFRAAVGLGICFSKRWVFKIQALWGCTSLAGSAFTLHVYLHRIPTFGPLTMLMATTAVSGYCLVRVWDRAEAKPYREPVLPTPDESGFVQYPRPHLEEKERR